MKYIIHLFFLTTFICSYSQTAEEYYNKGNAKYALGDKRGAIVDYNTAIELDSNYTDAYYNRGIARYKLGDKSGACLDWSKAGELGDGNAREIVNKYCK